MKWTNEKIEELKRMYSENKTAEEIANKLKITVGSVRNKAWRLGITNNKEYTEEEKEYIINNYKSYNLQEIANKLNRPKANICRFAREHGLERNCKKKKETRVGTRLYSIYHSMKERCKHNKYYENVEICEEWLNDYQAFYNWAMANGYNDNLTIDRIDVNGNYEPNNCRWANTETQSNNKRTTIYITLNGVTKNVSEWAKITGLSKQLIRQRYNAGKTPKEILKV